eukprot:8440039-Prorocentrum_lima.AAC.1
MGPPFQTELNPQCCSCLRSLAEGPFLWRSSGSAWACRYTGFLAALAYEYSCGFHAEQPFGQPFQPGTR